MSISMQTLAYLPRVTSLVLMSILIGRPISFAILKSVSLLIFHLEVDKLNPYEHFCVLVKLFFEVWPPLSNG